MKLLEVEESGRPFLLQNEIEISLWNNVDVPNDKISQATLRLTTHRIIIQKVPHYNKMVSMDEIVSCDSNPNGWFSQSTTLVITTKSSVQLQFSSIEKDKIVLSINKVLKEQPWKHSVSTNIANRNNKTFSSNSAGISGIIKKKEDQHAKNTESMDTAFSDLKVLMGKASSMVSFAGYLRDHHNKSQNNEVNNIMSEMGLDSPVTKESAGNQYTQELARQLYDFLKGPLQKDGIMSLTDVYCIYNRARGTGLISPDDLYGACLLFESLDLPLRMKIHDSGFKSIQLKSFTDEAILSNIKLLLKNNQFPLSITQFSSLQQISIALSKYYLIKAEESLLLCRDESVEGLIFYPNIFL